MLLSVVVSWNFCKDLIIDYNLLPPNLKEVFSGEQWEKPISLFRDVVNDLGKYVVDWEYGGIVGHFSLTWVKGLKNYFKSITPIV